MTNWQANRRATSLLLVFVMLCAQLILAHHATVHFFEDAHIGIADLHDHERQSPADHPAHGKDKTCQICLFSKTLSDTVLSPSVAVLAPDFGAAPGIPVPRNADAGNVTIPLRARAPPFLLS